MKMPVTGVLLGEKPPLNFSRRISTFLKLIRGLTFPLLVFGIISTLETNLLALWSYSLSTTLASHNGLASAVTCHQIPPPGLLGAAQRRQISNLAVFDFFEQSRRPQTSSIEPLLTPLDYDVP